LLYVLLGLVLLVVVLAAGARWYVGRAEADPSRDAVLPGLRGEVEVWRDSLGVPHVWARDEADLFRAVGYVHAQDRLWQMEFFRRVADGRMAEVLGPRLVDTDRFLRTLGMGRAAAGTERTLDPESRRLLQAYADGVNQWIDHHPGPLPPEFLALRFRPEHWTVRNTLAIGKIMAWDLADWNLGLDLQRATDAVGPELARDLAPAYPEWGATILGADAQWAGKVDAPAAVPPASPALPSPAHPDSAPAARHSAVPLPRVPALALALLDGVSTASASNAWVIGGARTKSGKPILANDTHLALRAPSLWYLGAIHGGGIEAAGMMIPGVPVIVIGHSKRVAWGFTNAMVDDVDFFVEQVDPADASRYRVPEGWALFEARPETIRVKGGATVVHTVRTSRHGPVLSDVDERVKGKVLAMRWTAQDPSTEMTAMMGMNRARSAGELARALHEFNNPHQNVVFADVDGNIGYWMGGRVPVRRGGDGILPVPGWTGEGDWTGWLSFDQHPHALNPAEGFVVTANNRQLPASSGYPYRIANDWAEPYRAMRIRELVTAGRALTAADVARQQMDVRDGLAVRYKRFAVRAAELAGDASAARELRAWTGDAAVDSRAASLFYVWLENLRHRIGDDEFRGKPVYFPRTALEHVLDRGGGAWVDDVRTAKVETLDEQLAGAMRDAVATVGSRTWGELHVTQINHPLGVVSALNRALGLNIGPFPNGGSGNTVKVAGYGGRTPPFVNAYGPSQRHVVDMADVDGEGGFVIPTGQSGVPTSRHYRDQTPMWRTGRLWRIPLERQRAEARRVSRLVLKPR
ncbi:MAG TPA: penicillin acylase family protein, partial [Longimicrobium sp.]|nr:penicillin acylase family protein [Longimicrobium sp.]